MRILYSKSVLPSRIGLECRHIHHFHMLVFCFHYQKLYVLRLLFIISSSVCQKSSKTQLGSRIRVSQAEIKVSPGLQFSLGAQSPPPRSSNSPNRQNSIFLMLCIWLSPSSSQQCVVESFS